MSSVKDIIDEISANYDCHKEYYDLSDALISDIGDKLLEQQEEIEELKAKNKLVDIDKIEREYGTRIIGFGEGYFFDCEWDGEGWCSIGGDEPTHGFMLPNLPHGEKKMSFILKCQNHHRGKNHESL